MVAWFRNTFSMSSSSRLHLLMFSSSCLKVMVEAAGAAAVVVVLLVRLAPAPDDAAKLVKAPVDELEVGRVRVEVEATGKEVEELMPPKLSPVDEVLVRPLPRFNPKPVEEEVVVAAFVVAAAAAADVRLKPWVEAVLELKPPKLKLKVGPVDAVVVVADDNPTPPVAEAFEVVDKRG